MCSLRCVCVRVRFRYRILYISFLCVCAHLRVHACTAAAAAVRAPHFAFLPACLPHIFLNSALILHSRGVHSQNRFARILSEASPRIYLSLLDESKPRGALGEKTRKKNHIFLFLLCFVLLSESVGELFMYILNLLWFRVPFFVVFLPSFFCFFGWGGEGNGLRGAVYPRSSMQTYWILTLSYMAINGPILCLLYSLLNI